MVRLSFYNGMIISYKLSLKSKVQNDFNKFVIKLKKNIVVSMLEVNHPVACIFIYIYNARVVDVNKVNISRLNRYHNAKYLCIYYRVFEIISMC